MSTHNIGFYEDLTKIIFESSSNTHLISSADLHITVYWKSLGGSPSWLGGSGGWGHAFPI